MTSSEELYDIAARLADFVEPASLLDAQAGLTALAESAEQTARAFSGSWLGYHAHVYYENLVPPPPGANFSQEWGLIDLNFLL